MSFRVLAPATAANLGPGFDTLGLAMGLWNEVEVLPGADARVELEGEGAEELAADGSNLVFRTAHHVARHVGERLPPFGLRCRNEIPLERGLGSSAAAVAAGVLIADRLLRARLTREDLLRLAVDVEGHADNVAACLSGGLVIAYRSDEGWNVERLDPSDDLRPVVLLPETVRVATDAARKALPADVPLSDAAFNLSRVALSVVALTRRPELLAVALEDRLHESSRLSLAPQSQRAFDELRRAGVPVVVSGSGPSLVAFELEGHAVPDVLPGWRIIRLEVSGEGAHVQDG
ncbi:MAG TPA: homoserine kinase [Actinomycetota bacterium]|nr:homoserine kinase [Actinomycetota bacterium]